MSKYDRYYPNTQTRKVFNDILGLREFCASYDSALRLGRGNFRIADMSEEKAKDVGYRGVHVYYQKNSRCYPSEILFNPFFDRKLNN